MGRNLCNGIPTKITISKKNNSHEIENDKDALLKNISHYINISDYDIASDKDTLELSIKKDIFNNNFLDCLKEVHELTEIEYPYIKIFGDSDEGKEFDYTIRFKPKIDYIKEMVPTDHKVNLKVYDDINNKDNYYQHVLFGKTVLEIDGDKLTDVFHTNYYDNYWILYDTKLEDYYSVHIEFIPLWMQVGKIYGEEENHVIYIINNLKSSYYKSKLSKDLFYCIFG